MEYMVIHNEERQRFEVHLEGKKAIVQYKLFEGGIAFLHTKVPEELEGRGIAGAMAKHVLDYAAAHDLKVKPFCPYIKAYIDRHPEYQANSLFHNKENEE